MVLMISSNFAAMKLNRYFLWTLMTLLAVHGFAQNRPMTIDEVDSILCGGNYQLQHSRLDIEAAEGRLAQAKKYENPEIRFTTRKSPRWRRYWMPVGNRLKRGTYPGCRHSVLRPC